MNMQVTEAGSTTSTPVPEGEFLAQVEKVDVAQWSKKDGSASGLKLNVLWEIQDEGVKKLLERAKVTVQQQIMLDLTDAGTLDMGKGKNVTLNRLREAVNLNKAGKPFSFPMLQGQLAKVVVKHRPDNDNIYAEVKAVLRAG